MTHAAEIRPAAPASSTAGESPDSHQRQSTRGHVDQRRSNDGHGHAYGPRASFHYADKSACGDQGEAGRQCVEHNVAGRMRKRPHGQREKSRDDGDDEERSQGQHEEGCDLDGPPAEDDVSEKGGHRHLTAIDGPDDIPHRVVPLHLAIDKWLPVRLDRTPQVRPHTIEQASLVEVRLVGNGALRKRFPHDLSRQIEERNMPQVWRRLALCAQLRGEIVHQRENQDVRGFVKEHLGCPPPPERRGDQAERGKYDQYGREPLPHEAIRRGVYEVV